jgi:hypothetical protein
MELLTLRIRPEKLVAIEMNHVFWIVGDPDFGFPSNVLGKFAEAGAI